MNIPPDGALHIASLCREHGLQVDIADLQLIVAGASGRVIMRVCPGGEPSGIIGVYWTAARADNGSFVDAAQGLAAVSGRDFVLPDDIKEVAIPTLSHRLVLKNDFYRTRGHDEEIIARLLEQIPVPTEPIDFYRYH